MKLGIPYMGSKRKLASQIVNCILENNPRTKYVYDLFGGGGAMSFEFLQRPSIKKVVYNEFNVSVCNLLRHLVKNGVTDDMYQWVSREKFNEVKDGDDYFAGFVKCCWSFGSTQRGYLFSKEREKYKEPLHEAIVFQNPEGLKKFEEITGIHIPEYSISYPEMKRRRSEVINHIKKRTQDRFHLEQFEELENCNGFRFQQFGRIERLQQLGNIEWLQQLEIQNHSYEDVIIDTPPEETIIYCDPPYEGTGPYQCGDFDHDKFYDWCTASNYKIYVSEYDSPLYKIVDFYHRSKMSPTAHKETLEGLFCNRQEDNTFDLF